MEQPLPRWSTNNVLRAFFPRVAIGCRLSLKIDRTLSPSLAGTLSVATWYDSAWIAGTASKCIFIQICGLSRVKRGDYQNCFVSYCVLKLCTIISTLRWTVLTVLCSHLGPILPNSFVFICVHLVCFALYCIVVVLLWVQWGEPDGIEA